MHLIQRLRAVLGVLAALCLTGCFQIEQVLNVKADGSGTVVVSITMTKEMIGQLKSLASQNGGDGKETGSPIDGMLSEDEAKAHAKEMGEGVKLEKVEAIKGGKFEGKRATYSFPDVSKLRLDVNLGDMNPQGGVTSPDKEKDALTFEFSKGSPATLVINARHRKPAGKKPGQPEDPSEAAGFAMAQQFLKDTRFTVAVNFDGAITETDAAHRDGTRVIIADIAFGELLKDPVKVKGLKNAETWDEAMTLFKGIPGCRLEPKEKIQVKFQ
jgi:hypothetical protein